MRRKHLHGLRSPDSGAGQSRLPKPPLGLWKAYACLPKLPYIGVHKAHNEWCVLCFVSCLQGESSRSPLSVSRRVLRSQKLRVPFAPMIVLEHRHSRLHHTLRVGGAHVAQPSLHLRPAPQPRTDVAGTKKNIVWRAGRVAVTCNTHIFLA